MVERKGARAAVLGQPSSGGACLHSLCRRGRPGPGTGASSLIPHVNGKLVGWARAWLQVTGEKRGKAWALGAWREWNSESRKARPPTSPSFPFSCLHRPPAPRWTCHSSAPGSGLIHRRGMRRKESPRPTHS